MKNLIRCHLNYLVSKTTIIVSIIVLIIILLTSITSAINIDNTLGYKENNYLYFYNIFTIFKIIIIFYSIFLFGYSFLSKSDQYVRILIAAGISRIKILISKIIAIIIIIFLICYLAYFEYVIIGIIKYTKFVYISAYLGSYLNIFIIAVFFGLFSLILIQRFDNIYTIIIPFALMNFGEIINEDENLFSRIYNLVIPNLNKELTLYYGYIHIFLLIILLSMLNLFYYQNKDL